MKQDGFTLIELIIAMAIFSFMLIIVTTGFITVVRLHQSAVVIRSTQDNTRVAMEQILRDTRQANTFQLPTVGNATFCLHGSSSVIYYHIDSNVLFRTQIDKPADAANTYCVGGGPAPGTSVLGGDTKALQLIAVTVGNALQIKLTTASTIDPTLINLVTNKCNAGAGNQFCYATSLTSSVTPQGAL